ncbi:DNA-binding transcriptional regulator, MerR family [Nocardioides scoriae]|uniref:DNA-binding transcriptional regulator, MerR family n=1 Tax=Nocardioides scoriae TaxID=642780 RepID=A0A1H1RT26_9ACTN|nr:MerR family transcriptional regulator [Nocardioides scoriae]SDS38877.1 DNA-binding transcriptional regulator, MerR family [Nocardioides scoriae]
MSAAAPDPAGPAEQGGPTATADAVYTVDELAAATGLTVRTTRYYAGLGLLPAPTRRGRMAYYTQEHRARLELIRALQDHGFTLSAIEKYLGGLPADAGVEDLALQRAMLTSWGGGAHEVLTRRQLEARAGRSLSDEDLTRLQKIYAVRASGDHFELLPAFDVVLQMADLDLPTDSMEEASEAINRHMESLADELTLILRQRVLKPFRGREHTGADTAAFEQTMARLRQLTLEAVVAGFQRAANDVITRSLSRTSGAPDGRD